MREKVDPREKLGRQGRMLIFIAALLLISLACNIPGRMAENDPEKPEGFVQTSVAETIAAQQGDVSGQDEQTVISSATQPPEITDTPTKSPTATVTPTSEVAKVYASANTNCRTGQGTYFQWLVTLKEGEEAEAVGVDTSGDYWYIRRPDQPAGFCWLWGKYATPTGPYQSLPVYTQVPTPTPGFDYKVTYQQTIDCGILWGLQYRIDNIGSFTLESWKTSATDNTGGLTNVPNEQNSFFDYSGCVVAGEQVDLTPGEAYYLNVVFDGDPAGHDVSVKIRICTKDDLGGECLKKEIRHTP